MTEPHQRCVRCSVFKVQTVMFAVALLGGDKQ